MTEVPSAKHEGRSQILQAEFSYACMQFSYASYACMFLAVQKISSISVFVVFVLKLLMKNMSNLFVRLFVISLLTFRYFSVIVSLFGAGAATIFTAPAPAPTKMCRLRLLLFFTALYMPAGCIARARAEFAVQLVGRLPHQLRGSSHQLCTLTHQLLGGLVVSGFKTVVSHLCHANLLYL